jgi:hypothetical protein
MEHRPADIRFVDPRYSLQGICRLELVFLHGSIRSERRRRHDKDSHTPYSRRLGLNCTPSYGRILVEMVPLGLHQTTEKL